MKILKTFQPFIILITVTIYQVFFATSANFKAPFNNSSVMHQKKAKNERNEEYLILNITDVYINRKRFPLPDKSKSSKISFTSLLSGFINTDTKSKGKPQHIEIAKNKSDSIQRNYKNELHHMTKKRKKINPIVSVRKKRTKSNRLLKKFRRDFRHMHKKFLNKDGSHTMKRNNELFKNKTNLTDNRTASHQKKIDFSRNRFKRTTVQGSLKPYVTENKNQYDLSKAYSFEYKIKDRNTENYLLPSFTNISSENVTEKSILNLFSNFISSDLTSFSHQNITSHSKKNSNIIISHRVGTVVPVSGKFAESERTNFSSPVSEAYKSAEKRPMKWPIKRVVSVEGDVIIGGLMMVHSRGEGDKLCGPVMPQGGVQALEVMLYTLKMINKDPHIPFRIGAHILDDCDTDTYGLEMALDFIKANLHYLDNDGNNSQCSEVTKPIWGVVGAPSSITSIQVSNLLRLFKIPMISPFSTSPELSNKHKYDYFCRTIPSDYYQVQVIVKIIDRLKWTYVSVIYEESNYGIKGLEELEKVLSERKICIAIKEKVLKDSGVPNEAFYDKVVARLLTKPLAKGVIVFASDQEVAGIMRAVKRSNITNQFSWIGSDGWSARNLVSDGNEEVVEGTISVQPQAKPVHGFNEFFFDRSPYDDMNPYFAEFWETRFECRLPFVPDTPFNINFNRSCDFDLRLGFHNVEIENQLQFVHQATCGFCKALINMHADMCGKNYSGVCEKMWKSRGSLFLEYIRRVNFTDFSKDEFRFDKNCDGPARYNIIHYKQTSPNVFKWVNVGKYENGVLNLNVEDLQFKIKSKEMPFSSCSQICKYGEVKKYISGDKCCWKCNPCSKYEVVFPSDETECKRCVLGTKPDSERKACIELESTVIENEFYILSITGSTGFGFFNVVTTFMVYVCNFNTAIVRASSREAQILVLTGALFLHANAYSFLLDPDEVVCSMQSYFSGIGYILIYGTLFWKSYRIVRIFDLSSHYKNMNSTAFILLVLGLCCIQKIKSVVWTYFVDPRKVTFKYPDEDTKIKLCSAFTTLEIGYFIAYIFPLTSIIFCYLRTKKITNTPKIFNDSPQIFFSIRCTVISWVAMFIMHFMTSNIPLRQNILALVTNLNGIVIIFALFYRSMFIIIFRPHLNTREYLRSSRANHIMKSSQTDDSQQAITRDTVSQLVMNELSGECSYNNDIERDVSNIHSFPQNENPKQENFKYENSVHVPFSKIFHNLPFTKRALSENKINEIIPDKDKTQKHVAFRNTTNKSDPNIPGISIPNYRDSGEVSFNSKVQENNKEVKTNSENFENRSSCDTRHINQKFNQDSDFSSNESIHEVFVTDKSINEEVECHRNSFNNSNNAQASLNNNESIYFDSSTVYFRIVNCVEKSNSSEFEFLTNYKL